MAIETIEPNQPRDLNRDIVDEEGQPIVVSGIEEIKPNPLTTPPLQLSNSQGKFESSGTIPDLTTHKGIEIIQPNASIGTPNTVYSPLLDDIPEELPGQEVKVPEIPVDSTFKQVVSPTPELRQTLYEQWVQSKAIPARTTLGIMDLWDKVTPETEMDQQAMLEGGTSYNPLQSISRNAYLNTRKMYENILKNQEASVQREVKKAMDEMGLGGALATKFASEVWPTAIDFAATLKVAHAFPVKMFSTGIPIDATKTEIIKTQLAEAVNTGLGFARIQALKEQGTPMQKVKAAGSALAYSLTAIPWMGINSKFSRFLLGFASNEGLSALSASFTEKTQQARDFSSSLGVDFDNASISKKAAIFLTLHGQGIAQSAFFAALGMEATTPKGKITNEAKAAQVWLNSNPADVVKMTPKAQEAIRILAQQEKVSGEEASKPTVEEAGAQGLATRENTTPPAIPEERPEPSEKEKAFTESLLKVTDRPEMVPGEVELCRRIARSIRTEEYPDGMTLDQWLDARINRITGDEINNVGRVLAMMAGPKTADAQQKSNLARAKRDLLPDGSNADQVWKDTGWVRREDGQWRFEISDAGAKFKINPIELAKSEKPHRMEEIFDHPELYRLAPEMKDVNVVFTYNVGKDGTMGGDADTYRNTIHINIRYPDKFMETMVHEQNHFMQEKEDPAAFAGYIDPDGVLKPELQSTVLKSLQLRIDQIKNAVTKLRDKGGSQELINNSEIKLSTILYSYNKQYAQELLDAYKNQLVERESTMVAMRWAKGEYGSRPTFKQEDQISSVFYLALPKRILDGETKMPLDTKLGKDQLLGRFKSMQGVSQDELQYYMENGLNEFLSEKRSPKEVAQWMEENGPKVEIRKLEANPRDNEELTYELASIEHTLDTLKPRWRDEGDSTNLETLPGDGAKLYRRWLQLMENRDKSKERNESATALYTMVNPKSLDQMPGAVDLLVRIPLKSNDPSKYKSRDIWDLSEEASKQAGLRFGSEHFPKEGSNVLVFGRGYFETLPDGRKVFHLFELQRDVKPVETSPGSGKWYIKGWKNLDESTNKGKYYKSFSEADAFLKKEEKLFGRYNEIGLKVMIRHALENGADAIAVSDAKTAMLTEMHDQATKKQWVITFDESKRKQLEKRETHDGLKLSSNSNWEITRDNNIKELLNKGQIVVNNKLEAEMLESAGAKAIEESSISQESGMTLHYDKTIPKIMEKLTGTKGEWVSFGEHKNAWDDRTNQGGQPFNNKRANLILKNPDGSFKTDISARLYSLKAVPKDKQFSLFQRQLTEKGILRGAVEFDSQLRAIIRIFKDKANVSTIPHEFGHIFFMDVPKHHIEYLVQWAKVKRAAIEEFLSTGKSSTEENWNDVVKLQEKFTNSFVRYLREGIAPTKSLKPIFDQFRDWLREVYQSVKDVFGAQDINPRIRRIFDEMLTTEEERTGGSIWAVSEGKMKTYPVRPDKYNNPVVDTTIDGINVTIPVKNLVQGRGASKEQLHMLGESAEWFPRLSESDIYSIQPMLITTESLKTMTRKQMEHQAVLLKLQGTKEMSNEELKVNLFEASRRALVMNGTKKDDWASLLWWQKLATGDHLWMPMRGYLMSLARRVERPVGGKENSATRLYAAKIYHVADFASRAYGNFNKTREEVKKAVRGFWPEERINAHELMSLEEVSPNAFASKLQAHMDEKSRVYSSKFRPLNEYQQKVLDSILRLSAQTGAAMEGAKTMISYVDHNGEVQYEPFKAQVNRYPRFSTDVLYRIMRDPSDIYRNHLANILYDMNKGSLFMDKPLTLDRIKKKLNTISKLPTIRMINMEFGRVFDKFPSAIRMPDGRIEYLLETNISNIAERMATSAAMRSAFCKYFPQKYSDVEKLIENFELVGGNKIDMERAVRSMNGIPLEDSVTWGRSESLTPGYAKAYRYNQALLNLYGNAKLTMALFPNIPEFWMKLPATVGNKRAVQSQLVVTSATMDAMLHGFFPKEYKSGETEESVSKTGKLRDVSLYALQRHVINAGAQSERIATFMLKDNEKMLGYIRNFASVLPIWSGVSHIGSRNEFIASIAAITLGNALKRGEATQYDIETLKILNYTNTEIDMMVRPEQYKTEPEQVYVNDLYRSLMVRVAKYTQGTNKWPVEISYFKNTPWARQNIRFDSYMIATFNNFYDAGDMLWQRYRMKEPPKSMWEAGKVLSKFALAYTTEAMSPVTTRTVDGKRSFTQSRLGTLHGGAIAAGFMSYYILSVLKTPGFNVAETLWDDNKTTAENWWSMYKKFAMMSLLTGPPSNWYYMAQKGEGSVSSWALGPVLPLSALNELTNMIAGRGYYKNQSLYDRGMSYLLHIPTAGPIAAMYVSILMGDTTVELERARKRYKAFQNAYPGTFRGGAFTGGTATPELNTQRDTYHTELKAALKELRKGDPEFDSSGEIAMGKSAAKHLQKAYAAMIPEVGREGEEARSKKMASSIRAMKYRYITPDERNPKRWEEEAGKFFSSKDIEVLQRENELLGLIARNVENGIEGINEAR